jgi:hypothetical protein
MAVSPELSVMCGPAAAYRRLAGATRQPDGIAVALRRPAFVALFIGAGVSILATGRISLATLASVTACWSFAAIIQTAAAFAIIRTTPGRIVSTTRALDLFFMGQGPWALCVLLTIASTAVTRNPAAIPRLALLAAPLAAAWTGIIVFAFCRTILQATPRAAIARTFLYQTAIWSFVAAYLSTAVQLWPRVIGVLGR